MPEEYPELRADKQCGAAFGGPQPPDRCPANPDGERAAHQQDLNSGGTEKLSEITNGRMHMRRSCKGMTAFFTKKQEES